MSIAWLLVPAGWAALYEAARRRGGMRTGARRWCWYGAGVLLVIAGEPPLAGLAQRSVWAQALQFGMLAFGVTPLAVLGLPRPFRDASTPLAFPAIRTPVRDAAAAWLCFLAVTIGWRVPAAVDAAASGGGWLALEALTLVGGTWWLWVTLTGASRPGLALARPQRIGLAAVSTWPVWIFAYVVGFSGHTFYPAFPTGAATSAQQELVTGVLLVTSALAFCPVIFVNLTRWLTADQAEAEAEMARYRLRQPAARGGADGG